LSVDPAVLYIVLLAAGIALGYLLASRIAAARLRDLDLLWRERVDERVRSGMTEREWELRRDAAARSGRAMSGRVLERFSPLMKQFPFDPHDAVWIGSPVDFIVFDGLSEDRGEGSSLRRIALLEVKSGSGELSKAQRKVREIVQQGKVVWEEVRIPY